MPASRRMARSVPSGMVRDRDLAAGAYVTPDLVTSRRVPVENISERPQSPNNFAILEASQAAHQLERRIGGEAGKAAGGLLKKMLD